MAASNDGFGAAAYALVVATLMDLIESGRIEAPVGKLAQAAEGVIDGLVEAGGLGDATEAKAAIASFRTQVESVADAG